MARLCVELFGERIEPAVGNASGIFSYARVLSRIKGLGFVTYKSASLNARPGFVAPTIAEFDDFGSCLNAMGYPNPGIEAIVEEANEYPARYPIFSLIPGSIDELEQMIEIVEKKAKCCFAIKLNISCPNTMEGEKSGINIGTDSKLTREFVEAARSFTKKPLIVKHTPAAKNILEVVDASIEAGADGLALINTMPVQLKNPHMYDMPVLTRKEGGGLSGEALYETGLDIVRRVRQKYKSIPIIGMGGIDSGLRAYRYFEAGADAIAIGTAFRGKSTLEVNEFISTLLLDLGENIPFRYGSIEELRRKRQC
ncbi:MAG: hypothetical protein ABIG30_02220 [Candidatus Aenigmatarchaeota archaeon]